MLAWGSTEVSYPSVKSSERESSRGLCCTTRAAYAQVQHSLRTYRAPCRCGGERWYRLPIDLKMLSLQQILGYVPTLRYSRCFMLKLNLEHTALLGFCARTHDGYGILHTAEVFSSRSQMRTSTSGRMATRSPLQTEFAHQARIGAVADSLGQADKLPIK